jgi:hypothetical protein
MQTLIITSDKTSWAVRPQLWLLDKYWKQHGPIIVAGYTVPELELPRGATFHSIGRFADYPVERWTTGLIKALRAIEDEVILFLMDDYWPFRDIDHRGMVQMYNYMQAHPEVARFDVCTDRLYANGVKDYGRLAHLDVIKSDPHSPYHFSFQASLWQRARLLDCLVEDETPWQAEINGDARLGDGLVLGTRQAPMRYTIAVQQGKFTPDGGYQTPSAKMNTGDLVYITQQGWIPQAVGNA